jgi:hypothetical protein
MPTSGFFARLIRESLEKARERTGSARRADVAVSVVTNDRSVGRDIGAIRFQFSKPIPEEDLGPNGRDILGEVGEALDTGQTGVLQALLRRLGVLPKVGRRRDRTTTKVSVGSTEGITNLQGQTVTETSLRHLLEIAARNYLTQDMQRSNAPLRYRTGRFANSLQVDTVSLTGAFNPRVSIGYRYMIYPYATFDPARSTQPHLYNRPYPGARNPTVLIDRALQDAARDVINSRFRIITRQTN